METIIKDDNDLFMANLAIMHMRRMVQKPRPSREHGVRFNPEVVEVLSVEYIAACQSYDGLLREKADSCGPPGFWDKYIAEAKTKMDEEKKKMDETFRKMDEAKRKMAKVARCASTTGAFFE
uniref:Uncharacterized protein n=1 Tax=Lotharella oceanica TaxID=641309 RepID=A0A7S2TT84_9EUKA|mmetsp:Transcript_28606/g.53618  ORF Transcript_28606/g.53618 Transcript_28606/m.53618 type:complete len:122 (+) Transcript_28606:335-700(+)|eukprot:CAMPEP_0170172314 /NCGR_PEP_ID=MMETSP0040_2-20121228/5542_1 /TAXON_ID=641309 /ORGANISM="Lotharella oceanica, Strain CCMP622" /LENGTH=121 /DNA_ID=CAMNT_0010412907 /DNA_START=332 /DNA_END=697 /DNA_ORIENTATION=-